VDGPLRYLTEISTTKPALPPNHFPIPPPKQPRNRNHSHAHKPQQTRRPRHPQPLIHLESEKRESGSERISCEAVGGHCGGTVERAVDVDEVEGRADEYAHVAPGEGDAGEHGGDPVRGGAGGPGEPEEAVVGRWVSSLFTFGSRHVGLG
jgi:hypothetical protein